jgi:hypothetical protein
MGGKEMKLKPGDKAIIIGKKNGHGFQIGEVITITEVRDEDYRGVNKKGDQWYFRSDEIESILATYMRSNLQSRSKTIQILNRRRK